MDFRRLLISIRLAITPSGKRRAEYIRRKNIFHSMGENCLIMKRKIPLYPELISIGNNVFIGAGSRILYDTKIGSQVIIATGSIITHDIPDNTVVAGVPARKIGTFEEYVKKRKKEVFQNSKLGNIENKKKKKSENMWKEFYEKHSENN